jgi:hypothetical protein
MPRRIEGRAPVISFERAARVGVFAYLLFFLVSGLRVTGEANSLLGFGEHVAQAVWGTARLSDRHLGRENNTLFALLGLLPVVGVFLLQLHTARRDPLARAFSLRRVLGYTLLFSVPLLFVPRMLSSDVYSYIAYGRLSAVHHLNPLTMEPRLQPDVFVAQIGYLPFQYVTSAYGPVWVLLSHVLTLAVEALGGAGWLYVLAYKLLALGCHLGCVALLWSILGRLRPDEQLLGTVAYAWNPLVLSETAWNAHNDVLMLLLLLLAVHSYLRQRPGLALLPLALSIPLKWVPAALFPLYVLLRVREAPTARARLQRLALSLTVLAAVLVLVYAPYWEGPSTLDHVRHAPSNHFTTNSLGDLVLTGLRRALHERGHGPDPDSLMWMSFEPMLDAWPQRHRLDWSLLGPRPYAELERALRLAGVALLGLTWLWQARRVRDLDSLLRAWTWTCFVFVTVTALWVWPWYLVWFVGLAMLPGWRATGRLAVLSSLTAPLLYFGGMVGPWAWQFRALLAFGPPLAMVAWEHLAARRVGSPAPARPVGSGRG